MVRFLLPLLLMTGSALADSVIATRVIRPREVLSPGDVTLHDLATPIGFGAIDDVLGQEARRTIYPGRPISADDIGPAAVVERNQIVALLFQKHGLTIKTDGRALSRAASGEVVRVMNLSSHSTLSGTAQPDGSVLVSQ